MTCLARGLSVGHLLLLMSWSSLHMDNFSFVSVCFNIDDGSNCPHHLKVFSFDIRCCNKTCWKKKVDLKCLYQFFIHCFIVIHRTLLKNLICAPVQTLFCVQLLPFEFSLRQGNWCLQETLDLTVACCPSQLGGVAHSCSAHQVFWRIPMLVCRSSCGKDAFWGCEMYGSLISPYSSSVFYGSDTWLHWHVWWRWRFARTWRMWRLVEGAWFPCPNWKWH